MKYLPIHQSILNKTHKYSHKQITFLNTKFEFNKYWDIFTDVYEKNAKIEQYYRNIFIKYFHNDIEIIWEN